MFVRTCKFTTTFPSSAVVIMHNYFFCYVERVIERTELDLLCNCKTMNAFCAIARSLQQPGFCVVLPPSTTGKIRNTSSGR